MRALVAPQAALLLPAGSSGGTVPRPSPSSVLLVGAVTGLLAATLPVGAAVAPGIVRVTVTPSGGQADGPSYGVSLSRDGLLVGFSSAATDLTAAAVTRGEEHVYVRDMRAGRTVLVSVTPEGAPGNGGSHAATVSADGRSVAFVSEASDLVAGDTNGALDTFVRDLESGTTTRVSTVGTPTPYLDGWFLRPAISADGRRVAFVSRPDPANTVPRAYLHDLDTKATTLVSADPDGSHVSNLSMDGEGYVIAFTMRGGNVFRSYVRDLRTGTTTELGVRMDGSPSPEHVLIAAVSGNGRSVAFASADSHLVDGDSNEMADVFVRRLDLGTTERVSLTTSGAQSRVQSGAEVTISEDGSRVAFLSRAQDLTADPGGQPPSSPYLNVFVRDLRTATTTLITRALGGGAANEDSGQAWISGDGSTVGFASRASDLVDGDTPYSDEVFLAGLPLGAVDTTPPVLTPLITPAVPTGTDGWWTGDVSLSWTTVDEDSEIGSGDGCLPLTLIVDQGPTDYPCQATSEGGTANRTVTLKRDATSPTGSALVGGPVPGTGYSPGSVPAAPTCTATDATSGVASCVVTGWSGALGTHRLTSVATDRAGNATTVVWPAYTVADPAVVPPPTPPADPPVVTAAAAVPAAVTLSTSHSVTAGNAPRVTGVVTDATGTPLAGVPVVVESSVYGGTGWTDVDTVTTDARGRYALLVRPTKHTLYGATVRTPTGELRPARPVAVEVAARMGLLSPLPGGRTVTVPRSSLVRGTLLPAYSGVAVGVAERSVRPDGSVAFTVLAQRDTGPDGSWAVPVTLAPGRHVLVAFTSAHAGTASGSTSRTVEVR